MVTKLTHLERLYPLTQEIDQAIGFVLSSDKDFGEVSIYDLCYAIVHRISYVFSLGLSLHRDSINTPTLSRLWTPVHIAVIAGNDEALQALIDQGAKLDVFDKSKWTPLHHATLLGRVKQIKMLVDAGASQTLESLTGGTCNDMLRCLESVDKKESTPIPLLGEEGDKRMGLGEFKQLTGATFLSETHVTPELMFREWEDAVPYEAELPLETEYAKQYRSFCVNPPIHRLKKVIHDSRREVLVSSPGMGLYANRKYQCGELMGEYKGLFTTGNTVSAYALAYKNGKGVDALKYRNEIPQINDGFINVVLMPGRCLAGLSARDLFVTADVVNMGEQFCWNYGYSPRLKIGSPYAELRPKEAREFIKHHKISDLVKCLEKSGKRTCSFEEFTKAEKFRYILQTPSVIFLMIFDGTILLKEGEELLKISVKMDCITDEEVLSLASLFTTVKECIDMRQRIEKMMPCLTKKYDRWITSLPARAGLFFGLEMATKANNVLAQIIKKQCAKEISGEQSLLVYWNTMERSHLEVIEKHLRFLANIFK